MCLPFVHLHPKVPFPPIVPFLLPLLLLFNPILPMPQDGPTPLLLNNDYRQKRVLQQQEGVEPAKIKWEETIHWEENPDFGSSAEHGLNTTYISKILNRLTNRTSYDRRLRPRYGEEAVDVGITIHIIQISSVNEVEMDFTLDFYLRQTWYDPRLAFAQIDPELARRVKKLTVGIEYLDRLWKPDTFFPNEKTSIFHIATVENAFLRIEPDGRIYTSQRMTVKAMCAMDLSLFPMDSQMCKLGLESYGYDVDDIDYYWGNRRTDGKKPEDAVAFDEFSLPQFRRTGYRVTGTHVRTASGEYARLYIEVILTRNVGFYLMNMVVPAMLIVSISWVSFWLSREASPARVGLGYLTVLTMTTLITTTNNSLPKVSYVKWLDIFLNFCFIMVFASLVEYAVVSYWNKRNRHRMARPLPTRSSTISDPTHVASQIFHLNEAETASHLECTCPGQIPMLQRQMSSPQQRRSTLGHVPFHQADFDCRLPGNVRPHPYALEEEFGMGRMGGGGRGLSPSPTFLRGKDEFGRRQRTAFSLYRDEEGGGGLGSCWRGFKRKIFTGESPSKIDQFSRCCFPMLFVLFNMIYWSALAFMSKKNLEKEEYVPFE